MSVNNSTRPVASPSYDQIQLPNVVPSGVVAISTVVGVLAGAALLIVLVHFRHKIWSRCESWRREARRHSDQVGRAKRAREEEEEPDKLREDSVVIHDVGFPEEAYYKHDRTHLDHRPQPSPSMFKDGTFFEELMTSYDEICSPSTKTSQDTVVHIEHVEEIIDDVVKKITETCETVDLRSNNHPPLRRNSSYKKALDKGLNFSLDKDDSSLFSPNNPFALDSCTSPDEHELNPFSNDSHVKDEATSLHVDGHSANSIVNENAFESQSLHSFGNQEEFEDDHNVCLEIDEALLQVPNIKQSFPSNCKWQSTPILGLEDNEEEDERGAIMGASDDETDNSLFNALKVSRSYSPVYKMSFNSSFGNMTRHNYSSFVNDDKD